MSENVDWPKGWAVSLLSPREARLTKEWRVVSPIEREGYTPNEARDLAAWLLWAADRIENGQQEATR
jgi:hypothetical protein